MAKWNIYGEIEYTDRKDNQIKIRTNNRGSSLPYLFHIYSYGCEGLFTMPIKKET